MTTMVAAQPWASLTPAQQQTILDSPDPLIDTGAELLNFDLTVAADISSSVQVAGGDVQWQGDQLVNRDVQITITRELAWGIALVRIYRTITDQVTGLAARVDRGVFVLDVPVRDLGSTVLTADGTLQRAWQVGGHDRSSLLDRQPGYSVAYDAVDSGGNPVTVLSVLRQAYSDAGLPGVVIDGAAAASVMPRPMVWPLIPSGSGESSSTDAQTSGGDPAISSASSSDTTWRTIINDLHSLISYAAVWCDETGLLRSSPYFDPATRAATALFDADGAHPPIGTDRKVAADVWRAPNRWIFTWSNMPTSGGAEQTPTVANGGLIVVDNFSDGPAAQANRNGLVYAQTIALTAATAADFVAQAAARVAADKRVVTTYEFDLHPCYAAVLGHHTIATLNDAQIPGGNAKVRVTSWTESFTNEPITITAEAV